MFTNGQNRDGRQAHGYIPQPNLSRDKKKYEFLLNLLCSLISAFVVPTKQVVFFLTMPFPQNTVALTIVILSATVFVTCFFSDQAVHMFYSDSLLHYMIHSTLQHRYTADR